MPKSKDAKLCYSSIHNRAHKADPKPKDGICAMCGKVANKKGKTKLVHSNKDHSYRLPINPDEWWWIHQSCHVKYDINCGLRKKPIGRKPSGVKQKIIAIVIKKELVESLDEIRKTSNITRSKLIRDILIYFCNDKELIDKVTKEYD